jgi:(p)ppGpp synthase/HD superfamily hydrolase
MHAFAQTNIQLINQLRRDGYSLVELDGILISYELVIRLFAGRFRASGKTFVAHLVGTASILGSLHVSHKLVAAGLIHAVYQTGDFGDGEKGISESKRAQVKAVVGDEVEEYVARYTALQWNSQLIPSIYDSLETLEPLDRDVLLMRLANELEEYLDLGILYCSDEKRQQANYVNDSGQLMIRMAESLGFPTLATNLAQAFKEAAVADIPLALRRPNAPNYSFLLVPQSYQRLMEAVASRLASAMTPEDAKAQSRSILPD